MALPRQSAFLTTAEPEFLGDLYGDEVCDGCGDVGEFWSAGAWYCYSCASCEVCQSPYCDEESHRG